MADKKVKGFFFVPFTGAKKDQKPTTNETNDNNFKPSKKLYL